MKTQWFIMSSLLVLLAACDKTKPQPTEKDKHAHEHKDGEKHKDGDEHKDDKK
jgi:hypothetical protein